jgi:competence protein ComFC
MRFYLLNKWKAELLQFFLPKVCVICKEEGRDVCLKCLAEFVPASPFFIEEVEAFACFLYSGGVTQILYDLKYNDKSEFAKIVASFILKFYSQELLEGVLVPIPISSLSLIKRGYSVPHLICFYLQKGLKLKCKTALKKGKAKSQVGLNREERFKNARNFFELKDNLLDLKGETLLLIDDLITTGATMQSAIEELKKLNPAKIKVFAFAMREI